MVMTIMHEEQSALILLKKGGKPKGEEDYEEMEPYERNAVEAFEKFCAAMRFKQNRLLVFYADPHLDQPFEGTTITDFFGVSVQRNEMPLLMMVETKEEKVSFYEPMEEITGDLIADWVAQKVFMDLMQAQMAQ